MDLVAHVAAVLERSVMPSIIARGGAVRVVAVHHGVVTLETSGSPGAVLPMASRIEALLRAAIPQVTAVQLVGPGGDQPPQPSPRGALADRVRQILDQEINPTIAAHRGRVVLADCHQGWVRIRLEGSCQGCSLAEVTVRQGIEPLLRARIPELVGVVDVTDHQAGTEPFFSPAKR